MNKDLFNSILDKFTDYLRYEKRFSDNTIKSYKSDLVEFFDYVDNYYPNLKFEDINFNIVRSWMVNLIEQDYEKTSINRKISCLRSFYKFGIKNNLIQNNPTENITLLKKEKNLPDFITEDELYNLILNREIPNEFKSIRDYIVLLVLSTTGCRCSELVNLKDNNINFNNNTILFFGKGNKERIVPILDNVSNTLKHYYNIKKQLYPNNNWFILTNKGEKSYPKLIYRIVNKELSLITSNTKKSPHTLRHTFATLLLNNGASINSVKEVLGHASLAATQIYTHNTIEQLKNVYNKTHPRS